MSLNVTDERCESLVKLDRKLSRASFNQRGINLTAEELSLLAELGTLADVSAAKSKSLEERAKCRQLRVVSTNEGLSGSTSKGEQPARPRAIDGTSGGTTPGQGAKSGEARAHRMFG
ncbi:hypothetical protein EDF56_101197 [Novosphingobium sp. PhB165]|uniref:hypothetical protein n=1 Tax=Novosphingobium sp. PhB165 TaxID=2485105 RepID=UPI001049C04E|nr:hypothetical protein [Novosphingobium sp. PhB165]TCM21533.1 hypothetical protein EDF56_101197 [Novosphingobium sp. PhB165]